MRRVHLSPSAKPAGPSAGPSAEPAPITRRLLDHHPTTVGEALRTAVALEDLDPFLGEGATLDVWEALATLAASDVALARAVEPHLDAVAILHQAGVAAPDDATWGVFAAEGPGVRLTATERAGSWSLTGTKPWCSLAATVSHALVTAWVSDDERRLFQVALRHPGVEASTTWNAPGLREIPSGDVTFDAVPATPVGETGWYLDRPGFSWGGISVAACWFGGAVGVARTLAEAAREPRRADDTILLMHLGVVDTRLAEAAAMLSQAAERIEASRIEPGSVERQAPLDESLLAKRVRATVAAAAEAVVRAVGHALGPAPLVADPAHAKRVADLELYLRQHHGERDDVSQGRRVRDSGVEW